jgi:hypothetical protein
MVSPGQCYLDWGHLAWLHSTPDYHRVQTTRRTKGPASRNDHQLGRATVLQRARDLPAHAYAASGLYLGGCHLNPMSAMRLTGLLRRSKHQYPQLVPHLVSAEHMQNLLLSARASFHNR